ncbi:MAG: chemotaxis protein CheA [Clostridia bacterium]|nr:chemotaxis protein CheA [Clostridia bacterium]
MAENNIYNEHMMEMFNFETTQLMEQLEEILLNIESTSIMTEENINEIFRIMHTIKGSSAMMMFDNIAKLTHSLEDLFFFIRENKVQDIDFGVLCEIGFKTIDFIGKETEKLENKNPADGDASALKDRINEILLELKEGKPSNTTKKENQNISNDSIEPLPVNHEGLNVFKCTVKFEEECGMENIRAFTVVRNLTECCEEITHEPSELIDNEESSGDIAKNGFILHLSTKEELNEIEKIIKESLFVEKVDIEKVENQLSEKKAQVDIKEKINSEIDNTNSKKSNIVNVNVEKMDKLMDLVGEIVITEAMVTNNPELKGLEIESFLKAARQLRKLNNELQDVVMSIRMIPIASTFHKMHRIVRDMSKKLNKDVELIISGEETEVDKNIIDNLGDPLMHLIRNAVDHGIEDSEKRKSAKKDPTGKVYLEALNNSGEIVIKISDDGKGLDKNKILEKAKRLNLLKKPEEEMSDKEVYNIILLPGFSTNSDVTEYSGRGVGMDVVKKSIDKLGGSISIESEYGKGTSISIKIPLTLAIIEGMKVSVGKSIFTIPIISIKESFKALKKNIIKDSFDKEMVMIRGNCYPVISLSRHFDIESDVKELSDGILIMVETESGSFCILADDIIGEQQVVVKPIPVYLGQYQESNSGIAGCAILGDANISIIIDVTGLYSQLMN